MAYGIQNDVKGYGIRVLDQNIQREYSIQRSVSLKYRIQKEVHGHDIREWESMIYRIQNG